MPPIRVSHRPGPLGLLKARYCTQKQPSPTTLPDQMHNLCRDAQRPDCSTLDGAHSVPVLLAHSQLLVAPAPARPARRNASASWFSPVVTSLGRCQSGDSGRSSFDSCSRTSYMGQRLIWRKSFSSTEPQGVNWRDSLVIADMLTPGAPFNARSASDAECRAQLHADLPASGGQLTASKWCSQWFFALPVSGAPAALQPAGSAGQSGSAPCR